MGFEQNNQIITIVSPLGPNELLLNNFQAVEKLSNSFSIDVAVASLVPHIDPAMIIGKPVTIIVAADPVNPRFFNGLVSSFVSAGSHDKVTYQYFLTLVPSTELLKYRQNCRIFQDKLVKDILTAIFNEMGFTDLEWKLLKSYEHRTYCVQYRETDFDFLHRLLEEEGIFYYFKHDASKHTLVLSDYANGYEDTPINNLDVVDGTHTNFSAEQWRRKYRFVSGKYAHTDYNFETPATDLASSQKSLVNLPNIAQFEIYDYPGEYGAKTEGTAYATTRMESIESVHDIVEASSDYPNLAPGYVFTVGEHWDITERKAKYVVTSVTHVGSEGGYRSGDGSGTYSNAFTCAPADTVMRPLLQTPKPIISGSQTALVVGPPGEEIYTDEYGRMKVQFYWDREGKKNDQSSCWIRVAQLWAGKKWGAQYLPRIGQEVVVSFLEGDPDRPLIIGSVCNADQMPAYELPANKAHSGVKSRSTKEGGPMDYNEIMFIDDKGKELLRVHAERNRSITVEQNDTETVGYDQNIKVGNDQNIKVANNQSIEVAKDQSLTVSQHQYNTITGNTTTSIGNNRSVSISQSDTLAVGANQTISISGSREMSISGTSKTTVGGGVTVSSGNEVLLKCGGASLSLKQSGAISLSNGVGEISIDPGGIIKITGPMVKINS